MTRFYQPLDVTVNGYTKKLLAKCFNEWYTVQITGQLEEGKSLEDVDIKLTVLKPLHAEWLVRLYNYLTTNDDRETILSG